ncbi:MAG: metal-dependent transcriptional regulator, partial [Candidatus Kapaibacteriota bacterium]
KRLASMGLVEYNSYHGAKLTPTGEKVALETIRFHRLLELYLKKELNYPLDKVHEEACKLEHFISEEFIERVNEILGDPKFDPHGHPIPTKQGYLSKQDEIPLTDAELEIFYTISHLEDDNPELLAYLESLGLLPGTVIKIVEKLPFYGPISLKIKSSLKTYTIGFEVAKRIFLKK